MVFKRRLQLFAIINRIIISNRIWSDIFFRLFVKKDLINCFYIDLPQEPVLELEEDLEDSISDEILVEKEIDLEEGEDEL